MSINATFFNFPQAEMKLLVKKGIEEYEEVRKEVKKHHQINEDCDNALIKVYKKEQDRMRCKMDAVLRKVNITLENLCKMYIYWSSILTDYDDVYLFIDNRRKEKRGTCCKVLQGDWRNSKGWREKLRGLY